MNEIEEHHIENIAEKKKKKKKKKKEMDGVERRRQRWRQLKQRLGFKGMGCCGSSWGLRVSDMATREEEEQEELTHQEYYQEQPIRRHVGQIQANSNTQPPCVGQIQANFNVYPPWVAQIPANSVVYSPWLAQTPANSDVYPPRVGQIPGNSGVNLATALAAERHMREVGPTTGAPLKSLMRMFEETDGVDFKKRKKRENAGEIDSLCCVCMERNKGAAFIPCGHTYCRVCSGELWLNRGSCPLCNRKINQILDIF
ncbi:unnamed protein product [Ilex paraguariensis]|uniref:RING-type domain-containing protein n=1 Tax=Ilex paraguariensis TaxID=185542 RepID=A0ABC8UTH4_9AQUA